MIPADKLILSSDCGFGRQGFNRTVAFYKAAGIAQGRNIVLKELGLEERYVAAADPALQTDVLPDREPIDAPAVALEGLIAGASRRERLALAALRVLGCGELVPERAGVVRLDVIHHVRLPDVDRPELVVEPDAGHRLLAGQAPGDRIRDRGLPGHQHGTLRLDVLEVDDRAVPGHDVVDVSSARIRSSASSH